MADYLDHSRDAMSTATAELWKVISGWTRDQMIDAGALVYYSVAKDLAHFAGVYEQDDWFLLEDRTQRLKPIMNDEYGNHSIAELVGYITLTSQQNNPYNMNKWSNQPNDMWSAIPYSVLENDQWTSSVGPIRSGSTSLPAKTAKWTTTQGKLTQAEANAAAKAFTSGPVSAGSKYYDDSWIKYNYASPEADALYKATQANSRLLKGKGAGLSRADIDAIRIASGEQPIG